MPYLLLIGAGTIFFLTLWIFIPGWTYPLFVLGAGAPELSPWLLLASLILCLVSATFPGQSQLTRVTIFLALGAAALASVPLAQAALAVRRFQNAMQRALGEDFLRGVPARVRDGLRPRPIVAIDLFRGIDFGEPSLVRGIPVAAPDGQQLTLDVYRPVADGRFPAVVQIYGGAWQRGAPGDNPEFARYLATRRYVVFAIDYRHAPKWPWPAQIADVRTALTWIREHGSEYGADVSRLALIGRSAGAHLALMAAYEPGAPPVQAVVGFYGPVDLEDGYRHPPRPDPLDVRAIDEALLSGTPDQVPDRYREASPIRYVTRKLPPTLLIHGARDHVVEARFGEMLYERLQSTGTPSVLLEIPWAGHTFDAIPSGLSAQLALYYTEQFLAWALN